MAVDLLEIDPSSLAAPLTNIVEVVSGEGKLEVGSRLWQKSRAGDKGE